MNHPKYNMAINGMHTAIIINDIKALRIITPNFTGPINLRLFASEAGASVLPSAISTDSHSWLQLTSISPDGVTREILVSITNGNIPSGTLLKLSAADCLTGDGQRGTATTTPFKLLKNENTTLISGIGSFYTGITETSGYNLTYSFMTDPDNLGGLTSFTNNIITVTFTISNE